MAAFYCVIFGPAIRIMAAAKVAADLRQRLSFAIFGLDTDTVAVRF